MGKRKANVTAVPASPAKKSNGLLKPEKRPAASSDSESEDDEEEPIEDHNETEVDFGQCMYEPDEMRVMIESFAEFLKDKKAVTMTQLEKHIVDWSVTVPDSNVDVSGLVNDFKKYLKNATRLKNFHIRDASVALLTYVSSERSLGDFKSFPVKPPSKLTVYCKKKNIQYRFTDLKDVYEKMRVETSAVMSEVEDDIKHLTNQYAEALDNFIQKHPNLTEVQQKSLNASLKRVKKQLAPKTPKTPRKGTGSSRREPETAFTLFCRSKADKYTDLSEETREKKLRKKFDKLSDAERDLLESLALNS